MPLYVKFKKAAKKLHLTRRQELRYRSCKTLQELRHRSCVKERIGRDQKNRAGKIKFYFEKKRTFFGTAFPFLKGSAPLCRSNHKMI
jgi:hypothetical protein